MFKRFIAISLALVMVIGLIPGSVGFAADIVTMKYYTIDSSSTPLEQGDVTLNNPEAIGHLYDSGSERDIAGFIKISLDPTVDLNVLEIELDVMINSTPGSIPGNLQLINGNFNTYNDFKNADVIYNSKSIDIDQTLTILVKGDDLTRLLNNNRSFYLSSAYNSDFFVMIKSITLKKLVLDQAAPSGLKGVAPTSVSNNDGKITGVTEAMEYRPLAAEGESTAAWSPVLKSPAPGLPTTEITGLAPGTYQVRLAAKEGYKPSPEAHVVVAPYVELSSDTTVTSKSGASVLYYIISGDSISSGLRILTDRMALENFLNEINIPQKATYKFLNPHQRVTTAAEFDSAQTKALNLTFTEGDKLAIKAENGNVKVYAINLLSNKVDVTPKGNHYKVTTVANSSVNMAGNMIETNASPINAETSVGDLLAQLNIPSGADYCVTSKNVDTLDHKKIATEVMNGTGPDYKSDQAKLVDGDFLYLLSQSGNTFNRYRIYVWDSSQETPTGLVGVAPTSSANNDGKITGVSELMEYQAKLGTSAKVPASWTPVAKSAGGGQANTEITGLSPGTYEVRYAKRTGYLASPIRDVIVYPYVAPSNDNKVTNYYADAFTIISSADNGSGNPGENTNSISSGTVPLMNTCSVDLLLGYLKKHPKATLKVVGKEVAIFDAPTFDQATGRQNTDKFQKGDQLAVKAQNGDVRLYQLTILNDKAIPTPKGQAYTVTNKPGSSSIAANQTAISSATKVGDLVSNLELPEGSTYLVASRRVTILGVNDLKLALQHAVDENYKNDASFLAEGDSLYILAQSGQSSAQYAIEVIDQDQASPEGLVCVAPTSSANIDGKITGVSELMEYRPHNNGNFIKVTGNEIRGLSSSKYDVRMAARPGFKSSLPTVILVPPYVRPLETDNKVTVKTPGELLVDSTANTISSGTINLKSKFNVSVVTKKITIPTYAKCKLVDKETIITTSAEFEAARAKADTNFLAVGDKLAVMAENGDIRLYAIKVLNPEVNPTSIGQAYTISNSPTRTIAANTSPITSVTTVKQFLDNLLLPTGALHRVTSQAVDLRNYSEIREGLLYGTKGGNPAGFKNEDSRLENGDFLYLWSEDQDTYCRYTLRIEDMTQYLPSGIKAQGPSSEANNDGAITGVTVQMEYKAMGNGALVPADWTRVTFAPNPGDPATPDNCAIKGLAAGSYALRVAERPGYKASEIMTVTVPVFVKSLSKDNKVVAVGHGVVVVSDDNGSGTPGGMPGAVATGTITSGTSKISTAKPASLLASFLTRPEGATLKVVGKTASILDADSFDAALDNLGNFNFDDRLAVKAENGDIRIYSLAVLNPSADLDVRDNHYQLNGAKILAKDTPITSATSVESLISNLVLPKGAKYKVTTGAIVTNQIGEGRDIVLNRSGADYKTHASQLSKGDFLYVLSECEEFFARYEVIVANANQAAPTGLVGVDPTTDANNNGKITGVSELMEYRRLVASGETPAAWVHVSAPAPGQNAVIDGLIPGTYQVRLAARAGFDPSDATEVTLKAYVKPLSSDANVKLKVAGDYTINPATNTIAPGLAKINTATTVADFLAKLTVQEGAVWKVLGKDETLNERSTALEDFEKAKGLEMTDLLSDGLQLAVRAEDKRVIVVYKIELVNDSQRQPTGLVGVAPTSSANSNGKITGTTSAMEYRLATAPGAFKKATDKELVGLAPGTYAIRLAAKPGSNPSDTINVVIGVYVAPPRDEEPADEPVKEPTKEPQTNNGATTGDITLKDPVTPLGSLTFMDLGSVEWANKAIGALHARGILKGKVANQFDPNGRISRAEFASITARLLKLDIKPYGNPPMQMPAFTDVNGQDWFAVDVVQAAYAGYMAGDGGKFNPGAPITRQEIATLIGRMIIANADKISKTAKLVTSDLGTYTDAGQIAGWANEGAALCHKYGIITGSNGRFAPKASATRAEAAVMLYRLIELLGL